MPDPIVRRENVCEPHIDWDAETARALHSHRQVSLDAHIPEEARVIRPEVIDQARREIRMAQEGAALVGVDAQLRIAVGAAWVSTNLLIDMVLGYPEREIQRRNDVFEQNRRQGVIEYALGRRQNDVDSVEGYQRLGLRNGMWAAAELPPVERRALENAVQSAYRDGELAVVRGEDHGECWRARMDGDYVFKRGVLEARRLREVEPAQYEQLSRRLLADAEQLERGRAMMRP